MTFNSLDEAIKFITVLHENSAADNEFYNDIHTYMEEDIYIVEWIQVPYSQEWGGRFEYVDDNQSIYTEYILPDNSTVSFKDEKEFEEYFTQWLEDNPQYQRDVGKKD